MSNVKQFFVTFIIGIFILLSIIAYGIKIAQSKQEDQQQIIRQTENHLVYNETINMLTKWVYDKNVKLPKNLANEMITFIYKNCEFPKVVLGIMAEESSFDIFAYRDDTKVYGLGQIQYHIWKNELVKLDVHESRDLFDWKKNVLSTDYIISQYYKKEKNLNNALSKYVGEIHNNMAKYRQKVFENIGEISVIEHQMIKHFISQSEIIKINEFKFPEKEMNS